jgi:hypothetical protein
MQPSLPASDAHICWTLDHVVRFLHAVISRPRNSHAVLEAALESLRLLTVHARQLCMLGCFTHLLLPAHREYPLLGEVAQRSVGTGAQAGEHSRWIVDFFSHIARIFLFRSSDNLASSFHNFIHPFSVILHHVATKEHLLEVFFLRQGRREERRERRGRARDARIQCKRTPIGSSSPSRSVVSARSAWHR